MEYYNKGTCRLCLNPINNTNSKLIDDITKGILDVILLKLNFNDKYKNFICTLCSKGLHAAFKFKSRCLHTDDAIMAFINFEKPSPVDLNEIYMKKNRVNVSDVEEICRLCMQPKIEKLISVHEVDIDMFKKYIPEVNLSATKNPVVCTFCLEALVTHYNFIKNCLDVENRINAISVESNKDNETDVPDLDLCTELEDSEQKDDKKSLLETETCFSGIEEKFKVEDFIKTEEIDVKYNDILGQSLESSLTTTIKREVVTLKTEPTETSSIAECSVDAYFKFDNNTDKDRLNIPTKHKITSKFNKFKCDFCSRETKSLSGLKRHIVVHRKIPKIGQYQSECTRKQELHLDKHMLTHKDPTETQWFECDSCTYKSKRKDLLKQHMLIHKNSSESHWLQCEVCDFKTLRKFCLNRHSLSHKDMWHNCKVCSFKTRWIGNLEFHMLVHKNPSEIKWHECDICSHKSKTKRYLKDHYKLKHQHIFEGKWYRCDLCDFSTVIKTNFNKHQLRHKRDSEIQWYYCSICDYKCKVKYALKRHLIIHEKASENQRYDCDMCDFRTDRKWILNRHMLVHKDASEIQWFRCVLCNYKSAKKNTFEMHMLTHKDGSEVQWFYCYTCSYKTINKSNLRKHVLIHKSEMCYRCAICNFTTKQDHYLKRHMLKYNHVS